LPVVIVFGLEKTERFPDSATVPVAEIELLTQLLSALKLPMTAVASATCPLLIVFGTVHAAWACPGNRIMLSAIAQNATNNHIGRRNSLTGTAISTAVFGALFTIIPRP
jgi:hypothetical protein